MAYSSAYVCSLYGLALLLLTTPAAFGADPFDIAKRSAYDAPREALAMLPQLDRPADRAAIQRLAVLRAASVDPATAAQQIQALLQSGDGPSWLGDILFADAVTVANEMAASTPENTGDLTGARRLMLASAARHPEAALQNWPLMARLPYSLEVLETAALRAPDEAVGILSGASPYSIELNEAFEQSSLPAMQRLVNLAQDRHIPATLRSRLAFANLPLATVADTAAYFHALAQQRLRADTPLEIATLDRGLTTIATEICQAYQQAPQRAPEITKLSPRDLYLLLAYARAGDEDTYFGRLFDKLAAHGQLGPVITQAGNLHLRDFLEYTLWFRRYPQLLNTADTSAAAAQLISPLFQGLTLDNAVTAADAIAATPERMRRHLRIALAATQPASEEQANIKQDLAASLARPPGAAGPLKSWTFAASAGTVLERYFFYDDADGVDSFASFRAQYTQDKLWHWEPMGAGQGWIRLRTRGIEIVANVPVNALQPANALTPAEREQRQRDITDYLGDREPAIIVHRGHAYHVEKTLRYVTRGTHLVYLGSCRGLKDLRNAIESAPQADIISTRAVGTKKVNDPLLKMLNTAVLRGRNVDWPAFWRSASLRFAGDADFPGYIPPHRNGSAAFLRLLYNIFSSQK